MKILAFCYDFQHQKTVQNLLALKAHGHKNVTCIAAPKVKLNIEESARRITPKIKPLHPRDVAESLCYPYVVMAHDMIHVELAKAHDVGVIIGARILKEPLVSSLPIINMHPGLLPFNRGLDNIKWAILNRMPQAVTTHFIDKNIDRGKLIDRCIVDVYPDDSLLDVFLRVQNMETQMMLDALKIDPGLCFDLPEGTYYKSVPKFLDETLDFAFDVYRKNYKAICDDFLKRNNLESLHNNAHSQSA